jgi:hypothetical protein
MKKPPRRTIIEEEDDARWEASFAKSSDKLRELADQALEHYRAGRTEILDPEKL